MSTSNGELFDAVVVGAGVAGASAAIGLANRGLRVALVDRRARCAPCFKAEKVEPDQADRLRELSLFDGVRPKLTPIRAIASAYRGRVLAITEIGQYGVDYWELANAIRDLVPDSVEQRTQRVVQIDLSGERRRVVLDDGSVLEGRIVVLANGISPGLAADLGLHYRDVRRPHSLVFGFDVELERMPEGCDSLTYYAERISTRLDYLTLFPIGARWRANLFSYLDPKSAEARAILRTPTESMARSFPRLERLVGRLEAHDRVEAQKIDLYQLSEPPRDGLVAIGDACQSVCPATGTGLSKVLTDVVVLCDHLPGWIATPGMGSEKLADYYGDPRKRNGDAQSLDWAEHRRNFSTRTELRWRVHRTRTWIEMFARGRRSAPRRGLM
jgi:2-polyprenyl-6-methoxyphenol hydroxylase-like FAD-dependent oxidoreductase